MFKRIEKLARGIFEYERPVLAFALDKVEMDVLEGQDYTGEFTFSSLNGMNMHGMVYASNPRMECLTPQFEGKNVRIRFQFHSEGLMEGDVQKGDFYVISNQGEYNLSFVANITRLYASSSIGMIRNLSDFTRLAKEDFEEAARVFSSKEFKNVLRTAKSREVLIYEGLSMPFHLQNVEEFLVGTGRKNSVLISVDKKYREFKNVTETLQDEIEIRKDNWGYLELEVTCDAKFIHLDKKIVSLQDFVGSSCKLYYVIDPDQMHDGKNFAKITLSNVYQSVTIELCAHNTYDSQEERKIHLELQHGHAELTKLYVDYRLKKIVTGIWAEKSCRILNHMQALDTDNEWILLVKAQILLINKQRQEALWILEDFKRKDHDETEALYAYYLYLCTLVEREPSYIHKTTERIQSIAQSREEHSVLFWISLFLKEEFLRDNMAKLNAIKQRLEQGNRSPYLYLEAYYLYEKDPYLLNALGDTEIHILWWASRQNALNKDIAIAIMNLAAGKRNFDNRVLLLLKEAYRYVNDPSMLSVICAYLIKGQCFAPCYLEWYAAAIEEKLRITGLNEAYMMSLDKRSIVNVPKVIQMYFQYDSNISYSQKAVLFVNIIANKEKQPAIYENYRRTMERFAMEQISLGRIDDNLSVIYEEMLDEGLLTKDIAISLAHILYVHKISCFTSDITAAVIIEPELKKKTVVRFSGNSAYVPIFSNEYAILLEDRKGRRYASLSYQIEKLMRPGRYLRKCLSYAPDQLEYALGFITGKENFYAFEDKDSDLLENLMNSEKVSEHYKAKLCPKALEYYCIHDMNEKTDTYLKQVDFSYLDKETRTYVLSLLIEKQMYDRAYVVLREYGNEQTNPSKLVPICSYEIEKYEYAEDEFLMGLCMYTVISGKYNDTILRYLCMFYNGPTKQMYELWQVSKQYELPTYELEERILIQMLYTTEFVEKAGNVYESYVKNGGNPVVCRAYLNYFAQSYFVENAVVEDELFLQLEQNIADGEDMSDACKLALLKYYAMNRSLQAEHVDRIDELLGEFLKREIYFSFYKQFHQQLLRKYFLYDKIFIEYHTKEHRKVMLNYCMDKDKDSDFIKIPMEHMYAGIYVAQFVWFFGDDMQYYIEEKSQDGEKITESNTISYSDLYGVQDDSCYGLLNAMMANLTLHDDKKTEKLMESYEKRKEYARTHFTIL